MRKEHHVVPGPDICQRRDFFVGHIRVWHTVRQSDNLDSITAVVVGGTSLFGGRGGVVGTLIGTLIVGIFRNGLQLMGVAAIYQFLITGVLVIVAVAVDQLSRRRRA